MEDWGRIIILSVLQGLTEFLPVSSSGHLALAESFLGFRAPGILLEVVLHGGTLAAIIVYYRKRIWTLVCSLFSWHKEGRMYASAVLLGSVPALIVYIAVGDAIERAFGFPGLVGAFLMVTGAVLLTTRGIQVGHNPLTIWRGLGIGMAQAVALLPGISRSGSTIVAARHLGIPPEEAAEFSLLLSVPAQGGALVLTLIKVYRQGDAGDISWWPLGAGFLVAGVVGYAAIPMLVRTLRAERFWVFGLYCIPLGLFALLRAVAL